MKILLFCTLLTTCTYFPHVEPAKSVETMQMEKCSKEKNCDKLKAQP